MVVNYLDLLKLAAPETVVVATSLVVLAADLVALRDLELRFRLLIGAMISCVGCAVAIGWMMVLPQQVSSLQGIFIVNPLTQIVKSGLLILTIFTLLLSIQTDFTTHVGEYFALVLFATVGMMFLVSSDDILMIFISLELTSLSLYVLTAFNKRNIKSAEAALKYFLFGGLAAAFTLFGLSWLYGLTGLTNLADIARSVSQLMPPTPDGSRTPLDPLLVGALVLTIVGFGFKIAAVPFHLWAPDAYEGAPAPSAALIASGSKLASFFVFARVMIIGFAGVEGVPNWRDYLPGWLPALAAVAAGSMLLGNLVAIAQSSVRRLLAYSAIAHGGYMLLGIMGNQDQSVGALVYYAVTYGLTTVGAFGVVALVQQQTGSDHLDAFAGLSRRSPLLAACMMVFMLSLAGIPPLAGFFGKFYLFASALHVSASRVDLLSLVILAIAMSAVSLYYYLQVLKRIYVAEVSATEVAGGSYPILGQVVLLLLALAVVLLGCVPDTVIQPIFNAVKLAGL
jgi:NADH-quinone oxidoreductase subunit N